MPKLTIYRRNWMPDPNSRKAAMRTTLFVALVSVVASTATAQETAHQNAAHDLTGIAFVASGTPGLFRLPIDDVRFR
jgi:hypothetical protein